MDEGGENMERSPKQFKVIFKFIDGSTKEMYVDKRDYAEVAAEIMNEKEQWFGKKGDLVNLRNVTTCEIEELI
jgi:hypothetical protein